YCLLLLRSCRPRPSSSLFPYTTLFRSELLHGVVLGTPAVAKYRQEHPRAALGLDELDQLVLIRDAHVEVAVGGQHHAVDAALREDRKSTRLNSSHVKNSYAVFCLKKKQ